MVTSATDDPADATVARPAATATEVRILLVVGLKNSGIRLGIGKERNVVGLEKSGRPKSRSMDTEVVGLGMEKRKK